MFQDKRKNPWPSKFVQQVELQLWVIQESSTDAPQQRDFGSSHESPDIYFLNNFNDIRSTTGQLCSCSELGTLRSVCAGQGFHIQFSLAPVRKP
ncbi:hypothetical protein SRHO_G00304720 [Serrasalmus rhombeus]